MMVVKVIVIMVVMVTMAMLVPLLCSTEDIL